MIEKEINAELQQLRRRVAELEGAARSSSAEALARAILDSLSEQIAVLGQDGTITSVNAAWESFARENDNPALHECGVGDNYFRACDQAVGDEADTAREAANGIRSVMAGERSEFELEYPCHRPDGEERWFLLRVTPLQNGFIGAVVTHVNITQRKEAERAMQRAKEAAEDANKAKSDFVSRMSHELRTPLNAILGFAQILKIGTNGPLNPAQAESLNHTEKAGWHLLELINGVLDLAKVEANQIELYMEDIDIEERVRDAMSLVMPLARERSLRLIFAQDPTRKIFVHADPFRVKQVLLNLLSNAIKYNREGGEVRIECEVRGGDVVRVRVHDTGSGIPPEDLATLFRPFSRLYLKTYAIEGTGIGLAISKSLVELMGGKIGVESVLGKGSAFWFELAARTVHAAPAARKPSAAAADAGVTDTCIKLLCIDDSPSHLQLMGSIFINDPKIQVLAAATPRLGLELARAHVPDLVLLDICLPDMDGFEVLTALQTDETTRDIPVIAVSANAMPKEIERALRAGFRRYLTKPIVVLALKKAVAEILADRSTEPTQSRD